VLCGLEHGHHCGGGTTTQRSADQSLRYAFCETFSNFGKSGKAILLFEIAYPPPFLYELPTDVLHVPGLWSTVPSRESESRLCRGVQTTESKTSGPEKNTKNEHYFQERNLVVAHLGSGHITENQSRAFQSCADQSTDTTVMGTTTQRRCVAPHRPQRHDQTLAKVAPPFSV
jgi:hypothetical protein